VEIAGQGFYVLRGRCITQPRALKEDQWFLCFLNNSVFKNSLFVAKVMQCLITRCYFDH